MRFLPKGSSIGPISIILSIQFVVLVASLTISNDLFAPMLLNGSNKSETISAQSISALAETDLAAKSVYTSKSLFPINQILNDDPEQEFIYDPIFAQRKREINYVVQMGDTPASIWAKNGATAIGAAKAITAVREAGIDRLSLKRGEIVTLSLDPSGDVTKFTKRLADSSTLIISGTSAYGYEASIIKPSIVEEERSIVGTITSSFAASAADQGISYEVIDDVVDLFSNRIEFSRAIQPGDSFTINFTEKRCKDSGKVLDIGPVLSASFKRGNKLFAAIRHQTKDGSFVYFDENGERGGDFFLRYPLKFTRISSTFSWARFHPVLQKSRPHKGVDFAAPAGTPVRTVGDGLIEVLGYKGSPGNMIRIKHSDRWSTVYMHLKGFAPGLRSGQRVTRGQLIGYVGSTGLSTGAHLHFELWDKGNYVDPMAANLPNLSNETPGLPKDYLLATLKDLEKRHAQAQLAYNATSKAQG